MHIFKKLKNIIEFFNQNGGDIMKPECPKCKTKSLWDDDIVAYLCPNCGKSFMAV